jgi:serine/threonine protein kinase
MLVDSFCIITEFCSQGTIFDLLHKKKFALIDWNTRKRMAIEIAEGMNFLHSRKILHRDLKSLKQFLPLPYFLTSILLDSNMNVKIADFGLSKP